MTTVSSNNALSALTQASSASSSASSKNSTIGQNEFLQLLITQLKNQDPMDPMKNDEFAVQMAQFSQVGELVKINDQLSKQSGSDGGSLASYLGKQITTNSTSISVAGNDGGNLKLNLAADASNVKLQLLNSDGSVQKSIDLGSAKKGDHTVKLNGLGVTDGEYGFKVVATSSNGGEVTAKANVAGIVSGYVPGSDPKLLIGTHEYSPSDITKVEVAS